VFYGAQRFDVVHDRRAHVEAEHRREIRRFDSRISAFAFERFDQSRFFAADVGPGAAMDVNIDTEPGAENVTPKEIVFARFFNGALEDFRAFREFASYVNVGRARIQRETRDQDSFKQLMRIFVDDVAILERTGFGFIRVAGSIKKARSNWTAFAA